MTTTRNVTTATTVALAAIAAAVSYGHMTELAHSYGEQWRSYLIPLSIDGLIVVASMNLLRHRRNPLAWTGLLLGILASIAANMASAEPRIGAVLMAASAPAVFAFTFELLLQQRRADVTATPTAESAQPRSTTSPAAEPPVTTRPPAAIPAPRTQPSPPPVAAVPATTPAVAAPARPSPTAQTRPRSVAQPVPERTDMQGRNNSRHRAVDAKVEERIRNLLLAGHSVTEVMQRTGYGRTVVYRIKAALNEIAAEQRGQMRSVGKR